jgi:putative ABC transport system permease protein
VYQLLQDVRFGVRTLVRARGFAAVAMLTLAISIGGNAAIFSFVDGVLLKPLPYPNPDAIVRIWERTPTGFNNWVSAENFLDWQRQVTRFESISAWSFGSVTLAGREEPVRLRGSRVSPAFFDVYGVKAASGRTFSPDEDQPGKERVVVLSHRLWATQFGSDPGIVGRTIVLDDVPHEIIGVLPETSVFDRGFFQVWRPLAFQSGERTRDFHWLQAVGRLKQGVTLEQARAEMDAIGAEIARNYPASNKGWGITVERLGDSIVGADLRRSLLVLLAAVGMVLLIGCVNLANLTLARGTSRAREVAVRAALGAGRGRLVRQFLTESVVLALGGGALGIALGYGMIAGLARLLPPYFLPSEARVAMDSRALLFVLAVSIVTGVLFGLAPALQATKPDLTGSLKEGGRGTSGDSVRRRLRGGLVVVEIALAFILLTGAGLLIRSFVSLQRVDPGFDATNVLTMGLPMPERLFVNGERANRHIERVLTRLAAVPGVREAAFTSMLPLEGWGYAMPCVIAGRPAGDPNAGGVCFYKMVTASYFSALRMRIERGRGLTPNDIKAAPPALVVNRTFVNRYLSGTDPIGQRVMIKEIVPGRRELGPEIAWEIVGVVADEAVNPLDQEASPGVYVSIAQNPMIGGNLLLRTEVEPLLLQSAMRAAIREVDPMQAITDLRSLEEVRNRSMSPHRLRTFLLATFASIALLLATIGIYGVISYSVARRRHEIGVRAALGASTGRLLGMVLGQGLTLTAIGLIAGALGAFALTRLLSTLLFGVTAHDPLTLAAVAALLGGITALASYLPARRAASVDPVIALRYE